MADPYLSVVATSRNDNHGGDLTRRMQLFLDGLAGQANRHQVTVELVLVEWNPPPDRPGLREALRWPTATAFFRPRIVVVPSEVHARLDPQQGLPLFQMIAKNVGIRRARGRFVLATNVDILFPDPLLDAVKDGLREGVLYRNDRLDVSREIPEAAPFDELMAFCREHVLRRHEARGTLMPVDGSWLNTSPSAIDACRQKMVGWCAELAQTCERRLRTGVTSLSSRVWPSAFLAMKRRLSVAMAAHPRLRSLSRRLAAITLGPPLVAHHYLFCVGPFASARLFVDGMRQLERVFEVNRTFERLHTNGCGDFTLLDRETWFRLRGYPEWPVFSWAIDSVFLFQADANHVGNVQWPADRCTYHIDHGGGWTPEDQANLFARLRQKGIPVLSEQDFFRLWDEMRDKKRRRESLVYNADDWGFAGVDLREEAPGAPGG